MIYELNSKSKEGGRYLWQH